MPSRLFDRIAEQYDAWYDAVEGSALYRAELETLRPMIPETLAPALEVGVGTGRFAGELGVRYGVDPAIEPLRIARTRGVEGVVAAGERLPFQDSTFAGVMFVFTLCFVDDAAEVVHEARRVLRLGGSLILGIVPAEGPLGQHYQRLGAAGHPIYREAHFFTRGDIQALLDDAGLQVGRSRSASMLVSDGRIQPGEVRDGDAEDAGFLAISTKKA